MRTTAQRSDEFAPARAVQRQGRQARTGRSTHSAIPTVWSPLNVAAWSFVFPPTGALMYAVNLHRTGEPARGWAVFALVSVLTAAVTAIAAAMPASLPPNTVAAFNVGVMAILYFDWKRRREARSELGSAPWYSALWWAVPATAIGFGAVVYVFSG